MNKTVKIILILAVIAALVTGALIYWKRHKKSKATSAAAAKAKQPAPTDTVKDTNTSRPVVSNIVNGTEPDLVAHNKPSLATNPFA